MALTPPVILDISTARGFSAWAIEIVPMPSRSGYREADYSLAILTRRSVTDA